MSEAIIKVDNISKRYTIGKKESYGSLREEIMGKITSLFKRGSDEDEDAETTIWALKDVSFEVKEGEVMGIIGRNGAGKSTLLKILSRITTPTSGQITMRGRVASLLEVGSGFHPELTGRENILLNGALLGMSRAEIKDKFDEIVAFSEIEKFLDTPVKRYSSGMYVRLAFAVAAHLEPEILIVDEVLAVGDIEFQKKCLGKMGDVARGGRTVLFVSHNMGAVQNLCERVLLLDKGFVVTDGASADTLEKYLSLGMTREGQRLWPDIKEAPGSDAVRMRSVTVLDKDRNACTVFDVRDPVSISMEFWVLKEQGCIAASFHFNNQRGELICMSFDHSMFSFEGDKHLSPGLYEATCHIPGDFLNNGLVFVMAALTTVSEVHAIEKDVVSFTVGDAMDPAGVRGEYKREWPAAVVRPRLEWTVEVQELDPEQSNLNVL